MHEGHARAAITTDELSAMKEEGIIATRAYYVEDDEERRSELVVSLFRPRRLGPQDYRCDFEVRKAKGVVWKSEASGIDSLHVLILALAALGSYIALVNQRDYQGRLRWEGDPAGRDLGLPTIEHHWPFKQ